MTRRSRRHRHRARASAGFTLIELLVVLAIAGLAMALVAANARPVSPATAARAAARDIAGALRAARSEAIMHDRSVVFTLDLRDRSFGWGDAPPRPLRQDLGVALLTSRGETVSDAVGHIRFDPDGSASGGRVAIAGGDRTWWVGIDWLTGRVSIVEKQR